MYYTLSKSTRSEDKLNWIAHFPKKKEVWTKKGKCVSPNPPSSAFSLFGDWGSYIFVTQNWGKSFWGKIKLHIFRLSIDFPLFREISIHIFWASRVKVKSGQKCKFKKNAISPTNWTPSEMLIGAESITKLIKLPFAQTISINRVVCSSLLLDANINSLSATSQCRQQGFSLLAWCIVLHPLLLSHKPTNQPKKICLIFSKRENWTKITDVEFPPCFSLDLKLRFKVSTQFTNFGSGYVMCPLKKHLETWVKLRDLYLMHKYETDDFASEISGEIFPQFAAGRLVNQR